MFAIGFMISSMYFQSLGIRVSSNELSINIAAQDKCSILKLKLAGVSSIGFGGINVHVVLKSLETSVEHQYMVQPHGVDGVLGNVEALACFAW